MLQDIIYKKACCCIFLISSVSCARILGIFPIDGRSHFNFHEAMMNSLLLAGHQVTLIAPFQPQNLHENLTIINSATGEKPLSTVAVPSKIWMVLGFLWNDLMEQDCLNLIKLEKMKDLKRFIEESKHGVILFSLGSIITKDTLAPELRTALRNTFAKIPQRVIWKFDGQIEGLSENVMLSKWVPQKEILAHKSVLAFISHGGLGSTYEAMYFAKPMILLPIFADQPSNAAILSSLGASLYIDFAMLNEINLLDAINKIINDTKYRESMADLSSKFRDEPMAPAELVKYWTEYVLRHKGALHLRPLEADMPLYKFFRWMLFC